MLSEDVATAATVHGEGHITDEAVRAASVRRCSHFDGSADLWRGKKVK